MEPSRGLHLLRPLILAYHGVAEVDDLVDPRRLVVSREHLRSHIRWLTRLGYRFATAAEMAAHDRPPMGTAAVTFDDGLANNLSDALPVLRQAGVRASFYVCPSLLAGAHTDVAGEHGRLLDEDGIRTLHRAGMEIGSHGLTHRDLRKLDDPALDDELTRSKAILEEITGKSCSTFAYPFGLFGEREKEAARRAGYRLALAWHPKKWERYAAPRLPAPPRHGALRLGLKMMGFRRRDVPE